MMSIGFAFDDPFGNMAKDFLSHHIYLQGFRCHAYMPKEKVLVNQCPRCWRIGEAHQNCTPHCKFCGGQHPPTMHQENCLTCKREDWKVNGKECSHHSCYNCKRPDKDPLPHAHDDPRCPARSAHIKLQ